MATDLIETDPQEPYRGANDRAAAILRRGGVVAIPTDALYSLVCDPLSLKAVGRIFQAEGREADRALPMIVDGLVMAEELATDVTNQFRLLAAASGPGR